MERGKKIILGRLLKSNMHTAKEKTNIMDSWITSHFKAIKEHIADIAYLEIRKHEINS